MKLRVLFSSLFLLSISLSSWSQKDLVDELLNEAKPKREFVTATFKSSRVISGASIEVVKKHALDFRVSHRFGDMAHQSSGHTLFGFDQATDIFIGFEVGVTEDFTLGAGRAKGAGPFTELWNGYAKYRVFKQTTDNKFPISITLLANSAVSSMKTDPFRTDLALKSSSFAHRFSYVAEALIARKFNNWLTLQLTGAFVWRNYIDYDSTGSQHRPDKNGLFFLGLSGRAKVSKRTAIIFEYYLPITKIGATYRQYFPMLRGVKYSGAAYYPPLNIGVEFETGGHVFNISVTNSSGLLENDFLPYSSSNWLQGSFRLGFTIARTFQLGSTHHREKKEKAN